MYENSGIQSVYFTAIYVVLQYTVSTYIYMYVHTYVYVTSFWKTDHIVTIGISKIADFKYWSQHGSLMLDSSHARFTPCTIYTTRTVFWLVFHNHLAIVAAGFWATFFTTPIISQIACIKGWSGWWRQVIPSNRTVWSIYESKKC